MILVVCLGLKRQNVQERKGNFVTQPDAVPSPSSYTYEALECV